MNRSSVHSTFLDYSAEKLKQLESRIQVCLDKLSGEQVWSRDHENENALGNLVLHLCGNATQWIISGVGGAPDHRVRDLEFTTLGGLSIPELKARLSATVAEAVGIIERLPSDRLLEIVHIQDYELSVLEAIYHVTEHFSFHTGQVVFITKHLTGQPLGFHSFLDEKQKHGESTP